MTHKLLVVDDELISMELMKAVFHEEIYSLDFAYNGKEAFKKVLLKGVRPRLYSECRIKDSQDNKLINDNGYDLIITDIKMPVMSGITFYKEIVKCAPCMRKQIVFLSAFTDEPDERKFLRENRCAYVKKPFNLRELRTVVNSRLKKNSL